MRAPTRPRRWTSGELGFLGLLWGSSYVLIEIALRSFSAPQVAFGRQLLAAVALAPASVPALRRAAARGRVARLVVLSLVMVGGPSLLLAAGQRFVPASLAAILIATTPLLTAVLALRLDPSQRSSGLQLVGIALGLAGVALLFGLDLSGSTDELVGGLLILLASVGYALGGFMIGAWFEDFPKLALVGCTSGVSALVLLVPALAAGGLGESIDAGPAFALVGLGLGGTALGWALYYSMIAREGPRVAAVVQYLAPAAATVLGVVLLRNDLTLGLVLGLALVLVGSALAASRDRELRAPPP